MVIALDDEELGSVKSFGLKLKGLFSSAVSGVANEVTTGMYNAGAAATQEPIWDSGEQAYHDAYASGLYSYDGGASWEPKRAPAVTPSYSLGGSGFNSFNVATQDPYQYEEPMPTGQLGLGQWQSFVDDPNDTYSLNTPAMQDFNVSGFNDPYENAMAETPWWNAPANAEPYEIVNGAKQYGMPTPGEGLGSPLNALNDWFFDPIAETGAQLTPAAIELARYAGPVGAAVNYGLAATGYDSRGNAAAGLRDLGSAVQESGGNPLRFGEIQNENFDERPWWQQIAAGTVYDPTNYIGIGLAKKAGIIDDATQWASQLGKADDLADTRKLVTTFRGQAPDLAPDVEVLTRRPFVLGGAAEEGLDPLSKAANNLGGFIDDAVIPPSTISPASAITPPPSAPTPLADTALNEPRRKLLDALTAETKFRTSGQADEIIHAGRVQQAKGIGSAIGNLGDDATFSTAARDLASGARTGTMLPSTAGLQLDEATQGALIREALDYTGGRNFDALNAIKALDKLNQGTRLQPAEIKNLRLIYGDEIADAVAKTNAGRIQTVAELGPEDIKEIARRAQADGKRIATLEVQAQRQYDLAAKLREQSRMAPTDTRLKKAADDALARAVEKENAADRLLADRAERVTRNLPDRAAEQARAVEQGQVGGLPAKKAEDVLATREFAESGQEAIAKAEKLIEKEALSPAMAQQAREVVAEQIRRQGILLDGMGDDAPGVIRRLYADLTGEVADPWVANLISQRGFVTGALRETGYSDSTARAIANALVDAEVKMRYGATPPPWIVESLQQAAPLQRKGANNAVLGTAMVTQEMKNTMFGIGDFAIAGQQGLKAILTQPVSLSVGIGNRIANKMLAYVNLHAIDTNVAQGRLPRTITDLLDGGATVARGAVDVTPEEGTLLRHIPGIARADPAIARAASWMSDLQFKTILGGLRDLSNEGNLVLLKLTGSDIQNPIVRQRSMKWANAFTSAGTLAQRTGRATAEKAGLLSPSMTRAQVQQLGLIARVLNNRENRVLGISAAIGTIGTMYAIGKALNDQYGVSPFEFDPSKTGFGQITLKNGTVVDVFPQDQVVRVLTRTARLAKDEDWDRLGEEWMKFGMGRSSPLLQIGEKAAGFGYQPGEGWKYGDYGEGMSVSDRLLNNLPIPPIVGQLKESGLDQAQTPLNIAGVTSFDESEYNVLDRKVRGDASFDAYRIDDSKPVSYSNLSPAGKQLAQDKYGKLPPIGPEGERAAEVDRILTEQQKVDDDRLANGQMDPADWRREYTGRKEERFIRNDEIYSNLNLETKDPILKDYYAAIDRAEENGDVDWDAVDKYVGGLSQKEQEYIQANTGLVKIKTPQTLAFEKIVDDIEASGYFDRTDANWKTVSEILGITGFDSYYDYRDAELARLLKAMGKDMRDIYSVREAEKFLDKQDPAKGMEITRKQWIESWAIEHPQEAWHAAQFGYWTPTDKLLKWLAEQFE